MDQNKAYSHLSTFAKSAVVIGKRKPTNCFKIHCDAFDVAKSIANRSGLIKTVTNIFV